MENPRNSRSEDFYIFTYIQITVYYRILLSKYSFIVSQQKSATSYLLLTSPPKIGSSPFISAKRFKQYYTIMISRGTTRKLLP